MIAPATDESGATDEPDRPAGARDRAPALPQPRSANRWFLAVAGIAVALVVVIGVRAAIDGWLPYGDDGYNALRAHDVFSADPPLLGTASTASTFSSAPTNHPGPMQFYLLAVPVALLGVGAGAVFGTALLNAVAIGGASLLVRRRLGPTAGVLVAVAFAGLAWSMGSVLLHDAWGPFAVVVPFALFVVASGLAAGGDARALVVVAVAGSMVLQTHVSYVLMVPGIGAVAFAGALLCAWRDHRDRGAIPGPAGDDQPSSAADDAGTSADDGTVAVSDADAGAGDQVAVGSSAAAGSGDLRSTLRWVGIALLAALVCWAPPLIQQATGDPGNITALIDAAQAPAPATVTTQQVVYVMAGTLAIPPWWFPPGFERAGPLYNEMNPDHTNALANGATVVLLLLVTLALWSAWRRRDRIALGAMAVAVAAWGVGFASVQRAPAYGVWAASYTRFLWPVSLWLWTSLILTATRAWQARRARRSESAEASTDAGEASPGWSARVGRLVMPVAAVAVVVIAVLALPERDNVVTDRDSWQRIGPPLVDAVVEATEDLDGPVLVADVITQANFTYGPYVMAELAEHDVDFVVDGPTLPRQVGPERKVGPGNEPVAELLILQAPDPAIQGEVIYNNNGLPPGQEEEMAELTAQLEEDGRTRGPLQLSDEAREFVEEHLPGYMGELQGYMNADPLTPDDILQANNLAFGRPLHWSDGGQLDSDAIARWAHYDSERVMSRVVVYLRPFPPPPGAATPS